MRVTTLMLGDVLTQDLQNDQAQLLRVQEELASGQAINQPSDNPEGTIQVLGLSEALAENKQYQADAQDAQTWLQAAQSALGSAIQVADQIRTLALEAANGTESTQALQALQAQLTQLYEHLVTIGNTQVAGRYLFNGQQTSTPPFVLNGTTVTTKFGTNPTQDLTREVAPGVTILLNPGTNQPASNVFQSSGPSPTGLLPAVAQILSDLAAGNTANLANGDLAALDAAIGQVQDAQAEMGASLQRVSLALAQLTSQSVDLQNLQGTYLSTDVAKAAVQLQELTDAYQAALAVGARMILPTLADYLP